MRLVVALGGNALLRRGEPLTVENQRVNVRKAAQALADLVAQGHTLVITHGNGPQVGMLALQASAGPSDGAYPLDVLGADNADLAQYTVTLPATPGTSWTFGVAASGGTGVGEAIPVANAVPASVVEGIAIAISG